MVPVPNKWNILSMLEWGTKYLKKKDVPSARLSMEWLLADVLKIKRLDLYLKYDRPLSDPELEALKPLLLRRANHEPLQYIVGFTDFMNVHISVTPDVLIPRPETEQLVELILEEHDDESLTIVDAGTGSGCIPVAIKKERPAWRVYGFDISPEALVVAEKNASDNETAVTFFKADLTDADSVKSGLTGSVDIIVSNPPYIRPGERESLEPEVRDHEPPLALFHPDPESLYMELLSTAQKLLRRRGSLYLEIHEDYGEKIQHLFAEKNWEVYLKKDYNKKNRFIAATLL